MFLSRDAEFSKKMYDTAVVQNKRPSTQTTYLSERRSADFILLNFDTYSGKSSTRQLFETTNKKNKNRHSHYDRSVSLTLLHQGNSCSSCDIHWSLFVVFLHAGSCWPTNTGTRASLGIFLHVCTESADRDRITKSCGDPGGDVTQNLYSCIIRSSSLSSSYHWLHHRKIAPRRA